MNKFLIIAIAAILLFLGYGLTSNLNKKSAKVTRVDCQAKTVTFESIYIAKDIKKAQNLLLSDNYKIVSNIEYSKLMPTILKKYFNKDKSDELLKSLIPKREKIMSDEKLIIDYYIYENDKEDKNKKNKSAKLYAGYVLFEFKLNNKTIYKIQSDYMQENGADIKDRISCVINSFLTL